MKEIEKEMEYKNKKVHVILQFPEETGRTTHIEEVKEILKMELHKQMKKRKSDFL
ncbi:MAG: hypothetical protein NC517_03410 [Firmicutes bacterium]|nr:hypothetical protein [Bacillota bacterium]